MKKVVILHPAHWEQAMGGAERQILYLTRALKTQNFDVHFIYEDQGKYINNKVELHLHPLKKINLKKRFGNRWFLYKSKILNMLYAIKPDIIYTRSFSSWSGIAAVYAKNNGIINIWAIASDNDVVKRSFCEIYLKPFDFIELYYIKKGFEKSSYLLTQNAYQKKQLFHLYKRNSVHIPNVIEFNNNAALAKNFKRISVVWLANLKTLKRPEIFIELVNCFKKNDKFMFKMIGRGHIFYNSLIGDAVKKNRNFSFLGELPNDKVQLELKNAHVLVNTSDYEGFPNTFIEALSNKMIIISRNVNPDEVLTTHDIGFICPTIEDMKETLLYLSQENDKLKEMGENAYRYVVKYHSFEKNIGKMISLMK